MYNLAVEFVFLPSFMNAQYISKIYTSGMPHSCGTSVLYSSCDGNMTPSPVSHPELRHPIVKGTGV
jgi:hypothetical protein